MKPDFKQIDIKQVSASKVVGPNNADWQDPILKRDVLYLLSY